MFSTIHSFIKKNASYNSILCKISQSVQNYYTSILLGSINLFIGTLRYVNAFVSIISRYVKLPRPTARLLFKNLNALWHLFLNTICQRLATPKKS